MIVSLLPVNHTKAEEHLLKTTIEKSVIGEALEDELSEENISVENFEISTDELVLETSLENAEGQTSKVTVEVEPGADHISLFTEELNETGDTVARIKSKNDTWSTSSNQAKGVASSANKNGKPINEVDKLNGKPKKGYYWHLHPYKRTPKAHAFYGGPVK